MIKKIINLSRVKKQLIMLLFDSLIVILILLGSFSIRMGYWFFPEADLIWMIFGAPIIAIPVFVRFGMYRSVVRYIGISTLVSFSGAVTLYALLWTCLGLLVAVDDIPRSVILINWLLCILTISASRVLVGWLLTFKMDYLPTNTMTRWFNFYNSNEVTESSVISKRALVYGAGDAGIQLVSALKYSQEYLVVGFIDDSKILHAKKINGFHVYSVDELEDVIKKYKVDDVLIAIPSISRSKQTEIINRLEKFQLSVRIIPSLADLAGGYLKIDSLRELSIKDLLGRNSVSANKNLLNRNIRGKSVLISGAGGSIGSELSRQVLSQKPQKLILYEINELALYSLEKELSLFDHDTNIYPILGSIQNKNRIKNVLSCFMIDTIYHAAAYKHVPMVEFNTIEGVENNIFGTLNVAEAAIDANVETFVLISSDKAVRPTNTMGATKRAAELILQALSDVQTKTKFSIVRFGNVLGSSGSVVPLFKEQIKNGGPITVTDENIIRYFMMVSEAVELVIQAGAMGENGDVFVLDMGDPIRISDLAKKMINLSGLKLKDTINPDGDIEIVFTGLRPGEKLFEELLIGNNVKSTENPLIMRAKEDYIKWDNLNQVLKEIQDVIKINDQKMLRNLLMSIVKDFNPQGDISDILYKEVADIN
jgi:FlaA1/EpsC-like NDP-sugar epimerase